MPMLRSALETEKVFLVLVYLDLYIKTFQPVSSCRNTPPPIKLGGSFRIGCLIFVCHDCL